MLQFFEYTGGILHAKTMVVDDTWATVGSANMDIRSFRLSFEINLALYGAEFADHLGAVFERDLRSADEVTAEALATRRPGRRVAESLARVLSLLL